MNDEEESEMIRNKKRIINLCVGLVLFLIAATVAYIFLNGPQESYSYAVQSMNLDQMAETAEYIVIGKPTGQVESLKADSDVTFILTQVQVESVIKGDIKVGDVFTLLETEGVPIDIVLNDDSSYVLLVEPYVPGIKSAAGAYVLVQANQGVYRIDDRNSLYEYDIEGKEQDTGDRIDQIRNMFQIG